MKKIYLLFSKNLFSYLIAFSVLASMSSCSNSYTASFQNVPAKNYAHQGQSLLNNENIDSEASELVVNHKQGTDVAPEAINLEIPNDLSASLTEMGISEKKSERIQKRLEMLSESIENSKTETGSINTKDLNLAERMLVKKALKKADKILAENEVKDVKDLNDVQKAQQMNRNVTIGLILILVGVVAGIFIWPIGAIVGTIGVVFLILGLLDY